MVGEMNRRGFFAAMLAPLVVPFTQPFDVKRWCEGYDSVYGIIPVRWMPIREIQAKLNQIYDINLNYRANRVLEDAERG